MWHFVCLFDFSRQDFFLYVTLAVLASNGLPLLLKCGIKIIHHHPAPIHFFLLLYYKLNPTGLCIPGNEMSGRSKVYCQYLLISASVHKALGMLCMEEKYVTERGPEHSRVQETVLFLQRKRQRSRLLFYCCDRVP